MAYMKMQKATLCLNALFQMNNSNVVNRKKKAHGKVNLNFRNVLTKNKISMQAANKNIVL